MIIISIIIVSYNTEEFLKKCMESLLITLSKNMSYEIVVVDNASSDNSVRELSKFKVSAQGGSASSGESSKFKVVKNKTNLGFSKANNIGIKEAKGNYLLFLNPDTIIRPKTLEVMVDFMESHKDTGAATCRVELVNGALDDASHRGFPTPWNAFCHFSYLSKIFPKSKFFSGYNLTSEDLSTVHEIDACAGSFMIVRREAGEQIKWWDEDYFFYGEDLDFCYRLKKNGWKIFYVPTVSILHYKGVSGGIKNISKHLTTANEATKKTAMKARFDAMRIFYKKHYEEKYPWIVNFLVDKGISFLEIFSGL